VYGMLLTPKMLLCGAAVVALIGGAVGGLMIDNPPIENAQASGPSPDWTPPTSGCADPCDGASVVLVNPTFCNVTIIHAEARGAFCSGHFDTVNANDVESAPSGGSSGPGVTYNNVSNNSGNTVTTVTIVNTYNNYTTVYDNDTTVIYETPGPIRAESEPTPVGGGSTTSNTNTTTTTTTNRGNEETNQRCTGGDQSSSALNLQVNVQVCNVNVDVIDDSRFDDNDAVDDTLNVVNNSLL